MAFFEKRNIIPIEKYAKRRGRMSNKIKDIKDVVLRKERILFLNESCSL